MYQLVVFNWYDLIYELVDVKVYVSYENIQFDAYEFVSMKIYFLGSIHFLAYQLD
jgi:hypothetical protein